MSATSASARRSSARSASEERELRESAPRGPACAWARRERLLLLDLPSYRGSILEPHQIGLPDQVGTAIESATLAQILASNSAQLGSFCSSSGTSSLPSTTGEILSQGSITILDSTTGATYLKVEAHVGVLTQVSTALVSSSEAQPTCANPTAIENSETLNEQLAPGDGSGTAEASTSGDMEWCISWFSSDCKRYKQGDHYHDCNTGNKCTVSYSRLLSWALGSPSSIIQACAAFGASELLARCLERHGIGWQGQCGKVYVLGLISAGCQCVLY